MSGIYAAFDALAEADADEIEELRDEIAELSAENARLLAALRLAAPVCEDAVHDAESAACSARPDYAAEAKQTLEAARKALDAVRDAIAKAEGSTDA